jgi:hypothetical protein
MLSKRAFVTTWTGLAAGCLFTAIWATTVAAQLIPETPSLFPMRLSSGTGTVRLDGLGGFEIAVADENNEINLWDYAANPAGYADDKDSWSIDVLYSHVEQTERDELLTEGRDNKLNSGTFGLGFHVPGNMGVGGLVDYAEAIGRDFTGQFNEFRVQGFSLTASKYLVEQITVGVSVVSTGLTRDTVSPQLYDISHDGTDLRGSLGFGLEPVEGVSFGARGDLISQTIDGESRSNVHNDLFDWSRPGHLWSIHGFVDRGRIRGVVDYTRQKLEGDESVEISWSERFVFNPTDNELTGSADTFSEERNDDQLSTRWQLDVVPRRLTVSGAAASTDSDFRVIANPNALGSLSTADVTRSGSAAAVGLSWITLQQRLLVAGEAKVASSDVEDFSAVTESAILSGEFPAIKNTLDELTFRAGAEYLLGETLAGRLGFVHRRSELQFFDYDVVKESFEPEKDAQGNPVVHEYNRSMLTVGVGLVPAGAIWQLDFAYDALIGSDLNSDQSRFSAALRYLF